MARLSGVTLPLFSLRTADDWGIGEIPGLPLCAEWLSAAGQRLIQVLPVQELADGETSPYGAVSAFAIDPVYVGVSSVADLDPAAIDRVLAGAGREELARVRERAAVDYGAVRRLKRRALREGFAVFRERELDRDTPRARALFAFVEREKAWLRDHALYMALRHSHDGFGFSTWPEPERDRHPEILALASAPRDEGKIGTAILEEMYVQWLAHEQWARARESMRGQNVALMGDMPFIIGGESADVWAHREQFRTDVSLGAPPDAFSADGQSWGLPAYDWQAMDADGLAWLRMRAKHAATLFDRFRIDHLVGFFRQWIRKEGEPGMFVPSNEDEQRARGDKVLRAIIAAAGPGAVIAEDLGVVPPFVRETMARLGLPGYKVLPWERDHNFMPYAPRSFPPLSVATWSTHDTAPITQWWYDLEPWERERLAALDAIPLDAPEGERELLLFKLLLSSGSDLVLFLVNEIIGDKSRINLPGTVSDRNWSWRLPRTVEALRDDPEVASRLAKIRALVATSSRMI